ncbi:MAG: Crp/Fnr family transcriptional regulator [Actinomycetota bacterium]|nr:Crp/Fnr family transcriptional regulator [Actinomycetota bacterium]
MNSERAAALLARTALFENLDDDARNSLASVAINRSYKKGHLICHQGDLGEALFIIVEGHVKVFVTSEEGDEMVLVTLGPSEVFGELSLMDGGPRSASAEALEPTKLLAIGRGPLLEVLRHRPEATDALLRSLGAVVRRLTEQAADLVFLDLHGRVAKLLLGLADHQPPAEGEVELDFHFTQTDLAAMVGGSRQSVNQILHTFERRGYLALQGRKIILKQPDQLRRRAGL